MSNETFRPFGATDAEYAELLVLKDGVPPALREPLIAWMMMAVTVPWQYVGGRHLDAELANSVRALSGIDLGQRAMQDVEDNRVLATIRGMDDLLQLRLCDTLLYLRSGDVTDIGASFDYANSKWRVGSDGENWRLVERLPAGVQAQVESLFSSAGAAGQLLHRSFTAAYGLNTNAGEAYKMAVKAVETAAHPVVEPRNSGATLGTMLRVMRDAKTPWTIALRERADHKGDNSLLVIALLQTLWDGQEDRHRDGSVSIDEARTAFHAAGTLVAWFCEGLIRT